MTFRFESFDPERYRRISRQVALAMAGQLVVFALLFTQLLAASFGGGFWLNALGVLLGLLATSLVVALLKNQSWMRPVRYGWQLKQQLSRVSGYLPALRRGMAEGDERALAVLAFYHQGMAQLGTLEARTLDDDAEQLAERQRLRLVREERGLPARVAGLDDADLAPFQRG